MREPGPLGSGSLRWDTKVCLGVLRDSEHRVTALQTADPSSRQRGRPTERKPQISDSNIPTGSNIWPQVPQRCSVPRHTVSRKVTSTFRGVMRDTMVRTINPRTANAVTMPWAAAFHRGWHSNYIRAVLMSLQLIPIDFYAASFVCTRSYTTSSNMNPLQYLKLHLEL
jgi:hypothetical protein